MSVDEAIWDSWTFMADAGTHADLSEPVWWWLEGPRAKPAVQSPRFALRMSSTSPSPLSSLSSTSLYVWPSPLVTLYSWLAGRGCTVGEAANTNGGFDNAYFYPFIPPTES